MIWILFLACIPAAYLFFESLLPRVHTGERWKKARRDYCEVFLSQLETALSMYRVDHGELSTVGHYGLRLLSKPGPRGAAYFDFKESQLDSENRVLDPWRHPIVFRVRRAPGRSETHELYSIGPNGIDEAGKGDDVTP